MSFCTQLQAVQLLRTALTFKTLAFQVHMLVQMHLHTTFKSLPVVTIEIQIVVFYTNKVFANAVIVMMS